MTVTAPDLRLYHSPLGLFEFQAEAVARCYLMDEALLAYDTGLGKTHIGMALAAMLFEDSMIDVVLVAAEQNKVLAWPRDFANFTDLTVGLYYKTKREKFLIEMPQVMVSTYETIRNDAAKIERYRNKQGKMTSHLVPGPLVEALRGKRVLVIYDEVSKLSNRGCALYKHHELMVRELRKSCPYFKVVGLTATPMERDPEGYFNVGRIVSADSMPTVAYFSSHYVLTRDIFNNPVKFKNLSDEDMDEEIQDKPVPLLVDYFRSFLLRKRKTDPDVIDQFPHQIEEPPIYVQLGDKHQEFYEAVKEAFADADELTQRRLFTLMRQIAGHPMSLLRSDGQLAQMIVEQVGEEGLRSLGSAKLDAMCDYLRPVIAGQGAQVAVFTFFGQSILPYLADRLHNEGYRVVLNHGQMTAAARQVSEDAFRAGKADIFLSSDAGSRGINLPEASYCCNFDMPITYACYYQRMSRIHRIDSLHQMVTCQSFVAMNTVEEGIVGLCRTRNRWQDTLLEDTDAGEAFVTAAERKELFAIARRRAKAKG